MQRAAAEIALLAPLAGVLGAQIVLRRRAFYAHAVGSAAFPGLVVAGPVGIPPALAALGAGGGFAIVHSRLGRGGRVGQDAVTALMLVAALALGVVLASDVYESGAGIDRLLFGSVLAIGGEELAFTAAALVAGLAIAAVCRRRWLAAGFDGSSARTVNLRFEFADAALAVAIAVAAVAALDAVGALLVPALLVVPAATARLFARSLGELELLAGSLALVDGIGGLWLAYELDVPAGAAIAVLAGAVFLVAMALRRMRPA